MALTELPADFAISEDMRSWAEIEAPTVNIDREHQKFLRYWISRRKRMHNWGMTWENWMLRAPQMGGILYTADQMRLKKLTPEYLAAGFRPPFNYENAVMYQIQFDAWDLKRRNVPIRNMSAVTALVGSKRL